MELEKTKTNELAKFDPIRKAITDISKKLKGFLVTGNDTRERAFTISRDANGLKNQVEAKRKELQREFKADKKGIKEKYNSLMNAEIGPIDEILNDIEFVAKKELLEPIQSAINEINEKILAFDKEEEKRREKERLRIEEENRKAEEKARKKREAEEKVERDRLAKEKAKADKKLEAENKTGIQAKLAAKKAEEKRVENQRIADEKIEADKKLEKERKEKFEIEKARLAKKSKGSVKYDYTHTLIDINLVPIEFLKRQVNWAMVEDAQKSGAESISGLTLTKTERLGFR